jgi:vacuolar-type H+-ATPase subunit I/STV1
MGKVVSILIGLGLIALGVWGCVAQYWQHAVVDFLKGGLVIIALLVGLGILVFGLSELRAAPQVPPEPPSPQPKGDQTPG